ncbi:unnamed protein product, partial [Iphiclides podalirius]
MEPLQADSVAKATAPVECGAPAAAEALPVPQRSPKAPYRCITDWWSRVFALLIPRRRPIDFPPREILSTIMWPVVCPVRASEEAQLQGKVGAGEQFEHGSTSELDRGS